MSINSNIPKNVSPKVSVLDKIFSSANNCEYVKYIEPYGLGWLEGWESRGWVGLGCVGLG